MKQDDLTDQITPAPQIGVAGLTTSNNPIDHVLSERADLAKYGSNARMLLMLQIRLTIDDIDTVASTALTDDPLDKKCDLVYVDRDNGIAVVAQAFEATVIKPSAKQDKASDLNTGVSWLLSRPLEELPSALLAAAKELRAALEDGVIRQLHIWFVHNLAESKNVREELKTVEHTAKNAIATNFPTIQLEDVIAVEVGSDTQKEWYSEHQTPILVTDAFELEVAGGYETNGTDWKAYATTVPASWIHEIFQLHKAKLFSANLRDYLGSKVNDKNINHQIKVTASQDGGHFWAFNNGLTALVNGIDLKRKDGKIAVKVKGLSIVNGAQTTGAIGSLPAPPPPSSQVQIRFIQCTQPDTVRDIIIANNSQNRLEVSDFRSNDAIQKRLKKEFETIPDAEYRGRRGGYDDAVKPPKNLLPSDACVQALAIMHQQPVVAYNQKSQVWTEDHLYNRYFSEQTHATHIVFSYALMRAVEGAKLQLRKKPEDQRTAEDNTSLEFFSGRGSLFVLASAIASCLEIITAKPIPNLFRVSFGSKTSPSKAQSYWAPLVESMLPFSAQLQPAVDNVLRDEKIVAASIQSFRSVVSSIKIYHASSFQGFTKHIVIGS